MSNKDLLFKIKDMKDSICLFVAGFAINYSLTKSIKRVATYQREFEAMSSMNSVKNNIYMIDYSGRLDIVSSNQVKSLVAPEDNFVAANFSTQLSRIVDAGIEFGSAWPARGGNLLLQCSPQAAEQSYDAVFGGFSNVRAPKEQVQNVPASKFDVTSIQGMARGHFSKVAAAKATVAFNMTHDFGMASRYDNVVRPSFAPSAAPVLAMAA